MVCIYCGSKTQVFNSRSQKRSNQVWRRRRCYNCLAVFTTLEAVDTGATWLVELVNGSKVTFERDTLFLSLYDCLKHIDDPVRAAKSLTETIIPKLTPLVTAGVVKRSAIVSTAQVTLQRFDTVAGMQYAALHRADRS